MRATEAIIDLGAIEHNVRRLREWMGPGVAIMAIVKANAYGHGAVLVSLAALHAGASCLGVATAEEGAELRSIGIEVPILVLGSVTPEEAALAAARDVALTVYDMRSMHMAAEAGEKTDRRVCIHIKIETGMNRIGVALDGLDALLDACADNPYVELKGVFTHFSGSGDRDGAYTAVQNQRFLQGLKKVRARGLDPMVHAANSAAAFFYPNTRYDCVRPGIVLYGIHPLGEDPALLGLRPALTWRTQVSHIHTVQAGESVGYGRAFRPEQPVRLVTLPVGYADGLSRAQGNGRGSVLIRGQRVPLVGRICMDQCMADITGVPGTVEVGDEAVLIGTQGEATITAEDMARVQDTIGYEIVTQISARVPRRFVEAGNGRG